jgi:succinyl-diaminopimelate desuccinylase
VSVAERIDAQVEARREDLFALCARLVATDSVNPPGRTAGVADVVRDWLAAEGVATETVAIDAEVPNVVAPVVGTAPGRHVVFNAHMDTMEPGDLSQWTVPPFELVRREGRAYGLGMGNMKGALAAMCLATALIQAECDSVAGRLTLTAVSDEVMFGDRGTVHLLAARPDLAGDYLISGEGPGFMDLSVAEKGLLWLDAEATGEGGHSSGALRGRTATASLAALLTEVDRLNDVFADIPAALTGVSGGEGDLGLRLSVNAGTLAAGTVRSQIATRATSQIDVRLPPGIGADDAEARIHACLPADGNITLTRVKAWDANWTGIAHPLSRAVAAAAQAVRGAEPRPVVRLPGSDARRWRDLGVPAICYGPQPTLSAGINDHALEQDVVDCAKIYARAALTLMAG